MAASMELTTIEQVRGYLSVAVDPERDALLTRLIHAVSEAVENYCGREFARTRRVEFYDGAGAASLSLRCRPVEEIYSIHDDTSRGFGAEAQLAESAYVLYQKEGLIRLCGMRFAPGLKNVRVEYLAGFSPVPAAVEQAAIVLVSHFYTRANHGADAIASESLGVYSVSYDTGQWPPQVRNLLAEFREFNL